MRWLGLMITAMVLHTTSLSSSAVAFCGFFVSGAEAELHNNASQVALVRSGDQTVLSMSNNYQGPSGAAYSRKRASAATGLANAPRGVVELEDVVRSTLPQLDISGVGTPR
ncbi:MAG: hypothetical protein ACE366_26445 [Bradymonadia bacterium]